MKNTSKPNVYIVTLNATNATPGLLQSIRDTFGLFPGDVPVILALHTPDAPPVCVKVYADYFVRPCAELHERLATLTNGLN